MEGCRNGNSDMYGRQAHPDGPHENTLPKSLAKLVRKGRYFSVTGTLPVDPSGEAVAFTFQRKVGRAWRSVPPLRVKPVRIGNRVSRYSVRTRLALAGAWRVKASYADPDYVAAVSEYRPLTVR